MSTTAKLSAIVLAAAVLIAGCGGGSDNTAAKSTTTAAPKTTTTTTTTAPASPKKGAKNGGGGKAKASKKAKAKGLKAYLGAKADVEAVASPVLGLSVTDLDSQLMSGTSLADLATQHNVDIQKLTDAFTMSINQKLADAKAEGTLTDAQSQKISQRLPQAIDKLLHRNFSQPNKTASGTSGGADSGAATSSGDQATSDTNS